MENLDTQNNSIMGNTSHGYGPVGFIANSWQAPSSYANAHGPSVIISGGATVESPDTNTSGSSSEDGFSFSHSSTGGSQNYHGSVSVVGFGDGSDDAPGYGYGFGNDPDDYDDIY